MPIDVLRNSQNTHLLWFRPISPLKYALPPALAALPWAAAHHLPIDVLSPQAITNNALIQLRHCSVWLLSSPTAAFYAAQWYLTMPQRPASLTLAVIGQPSLNAWLSAGGVQPCKVWVSRTGESMGLLPDLCCQPSVAILRAQSGREDLPNALRANSVAVKTFAIYHKHPHTEFAAQLNTTLTWSSEHRTPLALCFTSTDQAERVLATAKGDEARVLRNATVLASHTRIAVAASTAGFHTVIEFPDGASQL